MIIRKTAAVLLIAALCLSLASCGYNPETVGTITGPDGLVREITCGEYLAAQYQVVYEIVQQAGITDNQQIDMKKLMDLEAADGGTIRDFVARSVKQTLINRTATDYLYDKTDLGDDAMTQMYYENYIQNDWAQSSQFMLQNGIGYESFRNYEMQILKGTQLPYAIYGKGGEKELSEEFVNEFMETKVGRFTYIKLPYRKVMNVDNTQAENNTLKAYANEILAAIQEEKRADVVPPKDIIAEVAGGYADRYQNILGYHQEMDSITNDNQLLLNGDGKFTAAEYEQIFKVEIGEYAVIEGANGLYSIVFRHGLAAEDTVDNLFNNIITAAAAPMFQEYLAETAEKFTIEFDEKATKYYSPDKIVM